MISVEITPVIEKKALALAKRNGMSLDALLEEALVRMLEDEADLAAADEALRTYDPSKNISHEQMRRQLGLEP